MKVRRSAAFETNFLPDAPIPETPKHERTTFEAGMLLKTKETQAK
jgi:hypothetical protein